jgi:hypothetical protein
VAQLETLARGLSEEEPCSRRYFQILRLQLSVTKTAASLATKLRLTPGSIVDRYAPEIVRSGPKPWKTRWRVIGWMNLKRHEVVVLLATELVSTPTSRSHRSRKLAKHGSIISSRKPRR